MHFEITQEEKKIIENFQQTNNICHYGSHQKKFNNRSTPNSHDAGII